jgi:hypothetical protein
MAVVRLAGGVMAEGETGIRLRLADRAARGRPAFHRRDERAHLEPLGQEEDAYVMVEAIGTPLQGAGARFKHPLTLKAWDALARAVRQ